MEAKRIVAVALLILGAGIAIGRFSLPAKVVETEKTVYKDKIVEKIVYVKEKSEKRDLVTIRLVTIKPDGTKTIETKIYDKSQIEIVQKVQSEIVKETDKSTETSKTTEYSTKDWFVAGLARTNLGGISKPDYGLSVNRRILGPFYLGAFGFTNKDLGAAVGVMF